MFEVFPIFRIEKSKKPVDKPYIYPQVVITSCLNNELTIYALLISEIYTNLMLILAALTVCVSSPMEIKSTPVSAIALTLSR